MKELFSIPIYSTNESKFKKEYAIFIRNRSALLRHAAIDTNVITEQDAIEITKKSFWKEGIWKYNQIVGFIHIYLHENSVWFDLYLPDENRIMKYSNKKKFVYLHQLNGVHFSLAENAEQNNKNMIEYLHLAIECIPKKFYVDLSEFNVLISIIDFSKLK